MAKEQFYILIICSEKQRLLLNFLSQYFYVLCCIFYSHVGLQFYFSCQNCRIYERKEQPPYIQDERLITEKESFTVYYQKSCQHLPR